MLTKWQSQKSQIRYRSVNMISRGPAFEGVYTIVDLLHLKSSNQIPNSESWWFREIMDDPGVNVPVTWHSTSSGQLLVTVFCVGWLIQEECSDLLEGVRDMGTQPYGWNRRRFLSLK
jgi:hypothetical protein